MNASLVAVLLVLAAAPAGAQQQRRPEIEKAWALVARGQRAEAIAHLRGLVKTAPRDADARLLLGSLLMEAGERAESLGNLGEGVRLRPKSAEAHNAFGEAHHAFGDLPRARAEFEIAVGLDPAFSQGRVNLASVLLEQGEARAAAPHLDRALRLLGQKPDAAYPLYLRAKIFAESRDAAKAVHDLEQAVALRPDFAEAWSDLGESRKALANDEGAVAAFQKAVELDPSDAVARTRFGTLLLSLDRPHDAVAHLREAARLDPKNQSALYGLQSALRQDGQLAQAEEAKRRLAELIRERDLNDQNLVKAIELNNRGAGLEKVGDVRAALDKYRAALELQPEHVGIRTNLAVALLKLGQWTEGIAQLREALRRDPSNQQLQAALDDALAQARAHGILK